MIIYYLALCGIMSFITFCVFGADKSCAIHKKRRVPERVLLGMCFLGGAVGGGLGMLCFRHKTLKPKFRFGVPVALILNIVVGALIFYYL